MLWYCSFTWQPHTSMQQVQQRLLETSDSGSIHPERIRGWYNLAGGGAGFLIVETNDLQELEDMLIPWMDLVSWDVRAIGEVNLEQALAQARQRR